MKGLLLKDYYMVLKYCRSFFVVLAVFLAVSFVDQGNAFFAVYPTLITSLIPVTLISYDEREKWDVFSAALPYTKAQIVSSKYLTGLILQMIVLFLSTGAQALHGAAGPNVVWNDWISFFFVVFVISLFGPSILLPLIFKFGAEKGRVAYYLVVGGLCAAGTIAAGSGSPFSAQLCPLPVLIVLTGAVIVLYALSWLLSIRIYAKREL